jgi:hypothetical protein
MIRVCTAAALIFSFLLVSAISLRADVKADTKGLVKFEGTLGRVVNLFGGKAAREGVKSSVAVKGDRKATLNDSTGQIIDLNEEKVYDLDIRRKTYKVTTFAELRRRMEEARRKAEEDASKEQPEEKTEPEPEKAGKEIEVDFDVKDTGQQKAINGFNTRQVIMTIVFREKGRTLEQGGGLVLTGDMWLAPTIAALKEISEFDIRYAQQLEGPMLPGASAEEMAAAMAMYPMLKDAFGRLRAESGKMDGTPILTTLTIESVKSLEQMAAEKQENEADSRPSLSGGVGGLLGGLARRAAKRDEPRQRATFMITTTEVLGVMTDVAAGDTAIPMGFREVN